MKHLILTISIGPRMWCSGKGLSSHETRNYEHDLFLLVEAFRSETQTPQAQVLQQENTLGSVTLLLPGQESITPSQYCWPDFHNEVTGYESRLSTGIQQEKA